MNQKVSHLENKNSKILEWIKINHGKVSEAESKSINEFEKSLWLANSGAATVSISLINSSDTVTIYQFHGCIAFVIAIMLLLFMKLVAEFNTSRDRYRFETYSKLFFSVENPDLVTKQIRDIHFQIYKTAYLLFKYGSAVLFISGCILTLMGVNPVR